MEISNKETKELLAIYRKMEETNVAGLSDNEIGEALALGHKFSKAMEAYEKSLKEAALSRKLEKMIPEHDRKIVLVEKQATAIDTSRVYDLLGVEKFLPLCNVVASRAEKGSEEFAAIAAATSKSGKPKTYVQVTKLSKADKQKLIG